MCHVLRSKLPDPQKRKNVLNMLKGIGNPPVGWEVMHSDHPHTTPKYANPVPGPRQTCVKSKSTTMDFCFMATWGCLKKHGHPSTDSNHISLVGGIPTPLKNMTSSVGMMTFPI